MSPESSAAPVLLTSRAGKDGGILVVTLNRPQARNAMNPEMRRALDATFRGAEKDPTVRVVILTGAGPVFCAGMDLKAFAAAGTRDIGAGDMNAFTWFHHESISKPVIAALNGTAVAGGFEMVLACDLVVASEEAKIGIPEVKRGLVNAVVAFLYGIETSWLLDPAVPVAGVFAEYTRSLVTALQPFPPNAPPDSAPSPPALP